MSAVSAGITVLYKYASFILPLYFSHTTERVPGRGRREEGGGRSEEGEGKDGEGKEGG